MMHYMQDVWRMGTMKWVFILLTLHISLNLLLRWTMKPKFVGRRCILLINELICFL